MALIFSDNILNVIILTVTYNECRKGDYYADCRYAECRYAECRYAGCQYADIQHLIVNLSSTGALKATFNSVRKKVAGFNTKTG
jgi:hypothetical protein